jgi:phosphate transport system permease protein
MATSQGITEPLREFIGGENADPKAIAALAFGSVLLVGMLAGYLTDATAVAFYCFAGFLAIAVGGWFTYQEETARWLALTATVSTILVLGLITTFIFLEALPVFRDQGVAMFTTTKFSVQTDRYSMIPMVFGTIATTAIATLVAAPLGLAGALFISEIAPRRVGNVVKPAIETLAGIPSIVYGFIGFVILNKYLRDSFLMTTSGSYLLVGLVVGLMALPTVVSVAEDAIASIPESMKSGSLALGSTDWQTMTSITVPAAFSGISAAVVLGVGRAIGETMAATVILGHQRQLPPALYDMFFTGETLTSLIASMYGSAKGLTVNALFAAGVILFLTVLLLSVFSQFIEWRMEKKLGGER